ncbi:TolC family protein [Caldithrix abyssi]
MKHFKRAVWQLMMIILPGILGGSLLAQNNVRTMTLSQALDVALQKNPVLRASDWQKVAARKKVWEARSGFLPRINLVGTYTRYQEPMIITPIHKVGQFPPLDDKIFTSQFQVQLPIFNGGRTLAAHKAAKAGLAESGAQGEFVKVRVIQNMANIFLQAKEVSDKRHLVAQRLRTLRQRHRELSLLQREGRVSEADFALMNASLQSALSDSLELKSAWRQLSVRLGQVMGVKQPIVPDVSDLSGAQTPLMQMELLPDTTNLAERMQGPEIKKAKAQLMRASAMKSLAKRSFLPEISGFYVYNYNSSANEWDPIGEWAVGVTMRFPLFDGGRRIANVGAASASEKAAAANLDNTLLEQKASLEIAFMQWKTARQRRQFLTLAVESKQKYVEANRKLYKEGRIPLSELLTQETELLALQIQEKELRYAEQKALLDYHALLGNLNTEKVKKILQ